jgi:hypothetical protein
LGLGMGLPAAHHHAADTAEHGLAQGRPHQSSRQLRALGFEAGGDGADDVARKDSPPAR